MLKKPFILLSLFALIYFPAPVYANNKVDYLKSGINYFEKGDLKNAEKNLLKAIKLNPNNSEAYSILGSVYLDTGDFNKAAALFEKAIKINPKFRRAYSNLGSVYVLQGNYPQAEKYLLKALLLEPNNKKTLANLEVLWNLQAEQYAYNKDYQQALKVYQKLIKNFPFNGEYHSRIASVFLHLGKYNESINYSKTALKFFPNDSETYFVLGLAYLNLGIEEMDKQEYKAETTLKNLDLSKTAFAKTCEFGKNDGCTQKDSTDSVIELLKIAINDDKVKYFNIMLEKGKASYANHDYYYAINEISGALEKEPDNKDIINLLSYAKRDCGIELIKNGQKEEGKALILEAGKLSTAAMTSEDTLAIANTLKAIEHMEKMEFSEVIQIMEKIQDQKIFTGEFAKLLLSAYLPHHDILMSQGFYQEANKNMKNAIKLITRFNNKSREMVELRFLVEFNLSQSATGPAAKALRDNDYPAVEKILEKLSLSEPGNVYVISYLGYAMIKNGKKDEGIKLLEDALHLDPQNISLNYNLAGGYAILDKQEEAIIYIKKAIAIFPEVKESISSDKDFNSLKENTEFKKLML